MHRAFARVLATSLCLAFGVGMGVVFTPAPCAAAPPTITVPGPQTVNEGALLTFSVSATDPDGQPIFFRASGVPTGATFRDNHNNTGTFTWTPTMFQAGSYLPAFTADDTFGGRDTKSVQIDVLNVNNAPVLDPIGDRSIERGTQAGINVTGDDPDGDNLSYTQVGLPSYGTFSDNGNGTASMWLAPPANEPTGSTSMTVTVSDGSLTASETFSITVFALQSANPPVLAPIGNQTVAEGAVATVGLSASDADLDVMTWTVSVPGFASVSPTGSGPGVVSADLTLTPSYCASGSYPANVAVSDGFNSDNESFTINVTDVNRTPSWTVPTGGYAHTSVAHGDLDRPGRRHGPSPRGREQRSRGQPHPQSEGARRARSGPIGGRFGSGHGQRGEPRAGRLGGRTVLGTCRTAGRDERVRVFRP